MKNIYRYQRIEGKYIPGIIKNGNYFFTRVALYDTQNISSFVTLK